jgi:linoleoyl-CoA desaturase
VSAAPPPPRVSFRSGGDLISDVRREVDAFLTSGGSAHAHARLYTKAVVAAALMLVSWSILMLARPGLIMGAVCLAVLTLGAVLVGFCVQHDANHGAAFANRRYNRWLGFTTDVFLGYSSYTWRVKHNVAHHTYTNVDEYDDDISQTPFARLNPAQKPQVWYRAQHVYIWVMYMLMGLRMQVVGDAAALIRGRIGRSGMRVPRGWELVGFVLGKLIFIGWTVALPLLVYPWWMVLLAYLAVVMVLGLVMATTFQLAHCVEEASFAAPQDLTDHSRAWAVHQIETTVDFCPHNRALTWVLGGLNFQIEHHLFPRLPHTVYPQIARIVRGCAERHGVRYSCHPTLAAAVRSHTRHLRSMGRLGIPAAIDMG